MGFRGSGVIVFTRGPQAREAHRAREFFVLRDGLVCQELQQEVPQYVAGRKICVVDCRPLEDELRGEFAGVGC